MSDSLGIAILGCGWAGTRHAEAFETTDATLRWVVDTDEQRAKELAHQNPGTKAATDYHRTLEDPAVDCVDICLPHSLHAEVAVESARAGKHILCEKPIADSLESADRMIDTASEEDVVLMIGENARFDPVVERTRELLESDVIGAPALAQVTREADLGESFREDRQWFLNEEQAAGGIMLSGGIHDIEKLRAVLDAEVESVHAQRPRQRIDDTDGDDTSVATVRFDDGTVGVLVESFAMKSLETASGDEVHSLRIDCDRGSIAVEGDGPICVFSEDDIVSWTDDPVDHRLAVPSEDTFVREISHFLECVRTGSAPLTDGRSQRRALEIVLAAYESMETGDPIAL